MNILILLIVASVYLGWFISTIYYKKWRLVAFQIILPVVCLGFLSIYLELRFVNRIFGRSQFIGRPIYEFHSDRSLNGDGFSLEVNKLPEDLKKHFFQLSQADLKKIPEKAEYLDKWGTCSWAKTPFDEKNKKYLDFVLSDYGDRSKPFQENIQRVKDALAAPGNFHSFFYLDHGERPGNVDLFVIDVKNDFIFFLNLNT